MNPSQMTPEVMAQHSRVSVARRFVILAAQSLGQTVTLAELAVCLECERTETQTLANLMHGGK